MTASLTANSLPGVYLSSRRQESNRIRISERTVAGFLGICEKGPVDHAVKITDFNRFLEVFGSFSSAGYLAYAVYSFFNSGGRECWVVRTAHKGEEGLSTALYQIPGCHGRSQIGLEAESAGNWGNRISIRIWYVAEKTLSINPTDDSDSAKRVVDLADSAAGDTVRLMFADGTSLLHRVGKKEAGNGSFIQDCKGLPLDGIIAQRVRFNVTISDGRRSEDYLYACSRKNDERFFPEMIKKSRIVRLAGESGDIESWFPQETAMSLFGGGRDGIVNITPGDFIGHFKGFNDNAGLGIFESIPEVNLLCVPDIRVFHELQSISSGEANDAAHAVRCAMISQAERTANRLALLDAPDTGDLMQLLACVKRYDSPWAAMYHSAIEMIDPAVCDGISTVTIPPSGMVAGIISACDHEEGVFRAPAGKYIPGAVGIKWECDPETSEVLYSNRINCMKRIPGQGIKLWGARTLSSDPEWRYINVRRTFSKISTAVKSGLGWAVFEPNTSGLRKRIVRHVSAFLIDMWRKGYLAGKTPEEAFFIRCDDELNPPEKIDAGIITTSIGLSITRPAEYIVVTLNALRDDANVIIEEVT